MEFHRQLAVPQIPLPAGFDWLFPYSQAETMRVMEAFYSKYYGHAIETRFITSPPNAETSSPFQRDMSIAPPPNGSHIAQRSFIFGINPGRFGAGVTGVPFTDPVRLVEDCGIENHFEKRQELSAQFVWNFIHAYGGPEVFCADYYITSISPLGFVKDGKNINYYDDKALIKAVEPFVVWNIVTQLAMGGRTDRAICMGEGANFKFFDKLNQKHGFFEEVVPLPHPRWVMQYRRKRMDEFVGRYLDVLKAKP